jgi:hypothetical protein
MEKIPETGSGMNMIRIVHPDPDPNFLHIPDPGVKIENLVLVSLKVDYYLLYVS